MSCWALTAIQTMVILDIIILTMPHAFFYRAGTYIRAFIVAKVPILEGKSALAVASNSRGEGAR